MSAHLVHHQQVPVRVCAHRVRQLRGDGDDWRRTVHTRSVRYGRPGGLRSAATVVVSADGRVSGVLLRGQPQFVRERQREGKCIAIVIENMKYNKKCSACVVGARDHTSLSEDAIPVGRHANRSARRELDAGEAGQEQAEADHNGAGREVGQGTEGRQVRGMLGADTGKILIDAFMRCSHNISPCVLTERTEERFR